MPDSPSLRPTNLTLSGWFNFSAVPGTIASFFGKPSGSGSLDSYGVWYQNNAINVGICDTSGFDTTSFAYTLDLGNWHHVAMTFDDAANSLKVYLDGVLKASLTANRTIAYDNTRPFLIGSDIENGNASLYFPGQIDEVALFNRALTAAEVQQLAQATYDTAAGSTLTIPTSVVTGPVTTSGTGTLAGSGLVAGNLTSNSSITAGSAPGGGSRSMATTRRDRPAPSRSRLAAAIPARPTSITLALPAPPTSRGAQPEQAQWLYAGAGDLLQDHRQ